MALGKKTGGRKKGVPNKRTAAFNAAVHDKLLHTVIKADTPLEYMLAVMRDLKKSDEIRMDAAKAAAPYVHAKLAATTVSMLEPEVDPNATPEELRADLIKHLLAAGVEVVDDTPSGVVNKPDGTKH